MIRMGVIGYGYWGPNLVRNFLEVPGVEVRAVSELKTERLALVKRRYPIITATPHSLDLIKDPNIDAIVIATPTSIHFDLAWQALQAGKHVLVEKPLVLTSDQAERLIEEAACRNRVLMVDHTFVYTSAVKKIKELIDQKELGEIYYYDSMRVNLGLFRHDMNVLWDLAVHDFSIMDYVLPSKPIAVSASGIQHIPGELENVAYLTLFFKDSLIAHVNVNWLSPVKVRHTLIGGSLKMIVYNDLEPTEKVKVYDKGIAVADSHEKRYQMLIGYREGDMWAPHLDVNEALLSEALHFIQCIEQGSPPLTGGESGLRVIRILEAASRSMADRCRIISI